MSKTMYVGPTIPGVATRNTVYSATPETLERAATAAPYIKSLCVPLSMAGEAMRQIRRKEGAYFTFYSMALRDSAKLKGAKNYAL